MEEESSSDKGISGGSAITAGGDVLFGDISGQVAIGDYINQFQIDNPSGDEMVKLIEYLDKQRMEKQNQEILNSYSPSVIPDYPASLRKFVITNRVVELSTALEYIQDNYILLISGIGGVGKTTLARALVETRPSNVPIPFWFDFSKNKDATLGDVLEKLAAYMKKADIAGFKNEGTEAGQEDINKLTAELQKRDTLWLIFDNFETILEGRKFLDEGLDLLFTALHDSSHKAKIIITSRVLPMLADGEYLIDPVNEDKQEIKGLNIKDGIDFLKKNGLDELENEKLDELVRGVDGHPLALKLLVTFVKEFGINDTLDDLSMYQSSKKDTIKKARKLFDKLAGDEKELLERISVFRQPESMTAIKKMFTENTALDSFKKLIDKSLLETDHKGNYWLHPLVQEFSYEDLQDKNETHNIAFQYYLSIPLPEEQTKKEDLRSLIEAHYHACMAGKYHDAAMIIFNNNLHEKLDRWGEYRTLVNLYSILLPEDHLNGEPLLTDKIVESSVIANLGYVYSYLGQIKKAVNYYEKALKTKREIGDRSSEGMILGNLAIAYGIFGEMEKAIEYYEKALEIARETGDMRNEGIWLGNIGNAYRELGQARKAIDYSEKALEIARKLKDRNAEGGWLGNIGNAYGAMGQAKKSIEYYKLASESAREFGDKRNEGIWFGNIGHAYNEMGQIEESIEYSKKALNIAQEIGDHRSEGVWLGNIGKAYSILGEMEKVIEYSEKALQIAREVGDKHNENAWLGNIGYAYSELGQIEKSIEYTKKALVISREAGDRHNEGVWLGNIGKAYSTLDQMEEAIEYTGKALDIAREVGDRRNEEMWLGNIGVSYLYLEDLEKALEFTEQALEISRKIKDRNNEGKWILNLGFIYGALENKEMSKEFFTQAKAIGQENNDQNLIELSEEGLELLEEEEEEGK